MARSATRPRPVDAPGAPSRAIVRDFSRTTGMPYDVELDVRTVYDFVFSLSDDAGSTDDLPAADREWLTASKAALRTRTGDALELYGSEFCIVLAGLAVDRPEIRDAAGFIAFLDAVDDATVVRTVVDEDLRDPERRILTERALAGDETAIAALLEHLAEHYEPAKVARFAAIYRDPAAIIGPAREVLGAWLEAFRPIEARVGAMLRRDAADRRADFATLAPIDLIEKTTGGIRWLAEAGVRRVILAPSYFARPYNFLLGGGDWRFFGYPIADSALEDADPLAPPQAVVRLHRALGDETRLRILRLLVGRDHYLTEIAGALDLSKPTIKHHLALLRSAGLVTLTEEGGLSYYSLRRSAIEATGLGLGDYLRH